MKLSAFDRLLTDIEIKNEEHAKQAMQKLHDMGAKTVVISSTELGNEDVLVGFGSTVNSMYPNVSKKSREVQPIFFFEIWLTLVFFFFIVF